METKGINKFFLVIAVIAAAVLTSLFLVLESTHLFIAAYIFGLFGIAFVCAANFHMFSNLKSYPWYAAFPMISLWYLFTQLLLSAVFVVREQSLGMSLDLQWFIMFHIVVFAVFAVILLLLNRGKTVIESKGAEVRAKVASLRMMQADAESLIAKFPTHEKDLRKVADALRYSDPMGHASLAVYEEQIQREILSMDSGAEIEQKCTELLRLIADRNSRVKMLK